MPLNEPTITCPNCKTEIKLTESLAAPLIEATRQQYEQRIAQKETDVAAREAKIDEQIAARLQPEREKIAAEKAKELEGLQAVLDERTLKLAEAQKVQADFMVRQRELDDEKRELELTIQKKVNESLGAVREKAKQDAEDGLKLKVMEKEEQIASMQRQIEELKRRSEQGSQQLQGEVPELELEILLRQKFPGDGIEPVPKGEFGGDVLHRITGPQGQPCGTILWESKRTKKWSDTWLPKLRDDQRAAKAEVALIVSDALPRGVVAFDFVDGVWVSEPRCAIPVAIALRQNLIELSTARQAGEGQQTKMAMVYQYLTGPRFRHRVEAIVEKFSDMQTDLDRERKTMTRLWAKREEQIRGAIESTAGMYGDLQGIAGRTLQEIDGLDIPLLEAAKTESEGEP